MKKIYTTLLSLLVPTLMMAQGWPENYKGVMLQAFYWDSFDDSSWVTLTNQADELATTFDLIWVPQSGNCGGTSMGYDDLYWFPGNYNSSFGTENDLKNMISTFKSKGLKTIADVVINHRKTLDGKFKFPSETYNGVTYTMTQADVVSGDGGTGSSDTGEGWDGMPDLDHKSTNVQDVCKAYTKMLIEHFGYAGFRYDMVKGYSGSYTAMYNNYAQPEFSVGECWDGTNTIKNWINATNKTSAAFDFQFKYVVRNASDNADWTYLGKQNDGNWPLVSRNTDNGSYYQYAVTFVENHDTEVRPDGSSNGPLRKDTLAANAYMLAMPGTPCVFMKHWLAYKQEISTMVAIRKAVGIHNMSSSFAMASNKDYYAVCTTGTNGKLVAAIGTKANSDYTPNGEWTKIYKGHRFTYYVQGLSTEAATAWAGLGSGSYEGEQSVLLTAISSDSNAKLVYTTNGSNPTASSTQVASGSMISIKNSCTLKVGLFINGAVTGVITRNYTITEPDVFSIPDFCTITPGETCAFFEAPETWTNTIKCWAWDSKNNYTGGTWPGEACTYVGTRNGKYKVYKWTYNGTLSTRPAQIIFNNNGQPQTDDLTFTNAGYYNKEGLLGVVTATTGINDIRIDRTNGSMNVYTLDGRMVSRQGLDGLPKGIYIFNGKKVLKK